MNLTPKQSQFCLEYLKDLNATQAAIRAGYSEKTAQEQSSRLLSNVMVQQMIAKGVSSRSERTKIDSDWLLTRLAEEAEADVGDLYDESTGALKPVHMWPSIWRKGLVSGLDVDQQYAYIEGEKVPEGVVTKIRLSDRVKRLELIGRHVNVQAFKDNVENIGPPPQIIINRPNGN